MSPELRIPTGAEFTEGALSLQNGKRTEVSCCEGSTPDGGFVSLLAGLFFGGGGGMLRDVQLLESLNPIPAGSLYKGTFRVLPHISY